MLHLIAIPAGVGGASAGRNGPSGMPTLLPAFIDFTWSLENSVRDAEWGLEELRGDPRADVSRVSAIGHGGGGIPFYDPRLMRAPYLFIATADTRRGLDLIEDFTSMRFSDRIDVTLESPVLRHHDLSDIGRAVTAPMGIRGDAQAEVQAQYAGVQEMVVRFLEDHSGAMANGAAPFADWVRTRSASEHMSVTALPATTPAPTSAAVGRSLDASVVANLRAARTRDPEADVFTESALSGLISQALASGDVRTAAALGDLAIEVHPDSAILLAQASRAAEAGGNRSSAIAAATACAQLHAENDWRATAAIGQCRDRLARLSKIPGER